MELPETNFSNITNINGANKFPVKRTIFVLVMLIIVGEIAWVGWNIYSSMNKAGIGSINTKDTPNLSENLANLTLKTLKTSAAVGEKIPVDVLISSVRASAGTDVVIYYDPKLLSVDMPNGGTPVTAGLLYSDYPVNRLDAQSNRIDFSGISASQAGTQANGVLGTMNFIAKAPGKAKIWFDFTPGSTSDSNVVESQTSQDILSKVVNLEINIK